MIAPTTIRFRPSGLRVAFPHGVASVRQLVSSGIPERSVYHRCLDGGPWTKVLPGIVLLSTGVPTPDQLVHAAVLLGGPDAVVTGVEACRRYGLRRLPTGRDPTDVGRIHLLTPKARQVRSVGFVHVERTTRPVVPVVRGGLPLAPVVRAATDAARRLSRAGDIAELMSDAVQRGLCTVAQLADELERGSRRGTAMPRAVLRELAIGVRSAAEVDARRLWARSGLPEAAWNVPVHDATGRFLGIVDCWVDDVAMAWEIESSEWHLSPADHDRTVERAAAFVAAGVVYTASKPRRIRSDGRAVMQLLRDTHRQAQVRPRPHVQARMEPVDVAGRPPSRKKLA